MVFSSKLSKFGKGKYLSATIKNNKTIYIYYFLSGILNKEVNIENNNMTLNKNNINLPYNEVVEIGNYLVTRLDKSIGIIINEKQN